MLPTGHKKRLELNSKDISPILSSGRFYWIAEHLDQFRNLLPLRVKINMLSFTAYFLIQNEIHLFAGPNYLRYIWIVHNYVTYTYVTVNVGGWWLYHNVLSCCWRGDWCAAIICKVEESKVHIFSNWDSTRTSSICSRWVSTVGIMY